MTLMIPIPTILFCGVLLGTCLLLVDFVWKGNALLEDSMHGMTSGGQSFPGNVQIDHQRRAEKGEWSPVGRGICSRGCVGEACQLPGGAHGWLEACAFYVAFVRACPTFANARVAEHGTLAYDLRTVLPPVNCREVSSSMCSNSRTCRSPGCAPWHGEHSLACCNTAFSSDACYLFLMLHLVAACAVLGPLRIRPLHTQCTTPHRSSLTSLSTALTRATRCDVLCGLVHSSAAAHATVALTNADRAWSYH